MEKSKKLNELFNTLKEQTNEKKEMTKSKKKLGRLPREKEETNYDPFPGYNCPRFNIIFNTPAGNRININAPIDATVREILVHYIQRIGLGPGVIQNGIFFFYNGAKLTKNVEQLLVKEAFIDTTNIIVVDTKSLIAAKKQ